MSFDHTTGIYSSSVVELMRVTEAAMASSTISRQIEEIAKFNSIFGSNSILAFSKIDWSVGSVIKNLWLEKPYPTSVMDQELVRIGKTIEEMNDLGKMARHIGEWEAAVRRTMGAGIGTVWARASSTHFLSKHEELFQSLAEFEQMAPLRALANLQNSPFSFLDEEVTTRISESIHGYEEVFSPTVDQSIKNEIATAKDFNQLSSPAKRFLAYFLYAIFHLMGALQTSMMWDVLKEIESDLRAARTKAQVISATQEANLAGMREALKPFRVTTATSLHVRELPTTSSEAIGLIPIGTVVEVLDKSNRSWLLVEVEIDGEFQQGWVFRRYTTTFK